MINTDDIESKFDKNGNVLDFAGNTVVCFFRDPSNPVHKEMEWAQKQLAEAPFAGKYVPVPKSTFHMTVIPLMDQEQRNTKIWSSLVKRDAMINDIDIKFKNIFESIPSPGSFKMKIDSCEDVRVILSPYNSETEMKLREYRDNISKHTGIKLPNHDTYVFHVTLFYQLKELTHIEKQMLVSILDRISIRLKSSLESIITDFPEFVIFNNMYGYFSDLSMRSIKYD